MNRWWKRKLSVRPALSVGLTRLGKMDSMQITEPMVMPSEARGLVCLSSAHSLIVSRWKMPAKVSFHRKAQALVSGRAKNAMPFLS